MGIIDSKNVYLNQDDLVWVLYERRWEIAIKGVVFLLCATCVVLMLCFIYSKIRNIVMLRRRKRENVGEVTLDLAEHVEMLRAYAGEVHTLVDIGHYSETEVIE